MQPNELRVKRAAEVIGISERMVQLLVKKGVAGPFPGARYLDPENPKGAIVIPLAEVLAEIKRRAQSSD